MRANLATLVDDFRRHSAETAVVTHRGNRAYRTTYAELATLTGRFSAELDRRNIAPGERVVLWGANSAEWVAVFFGCVLRGVMVVPLDAGGTAEFAARVVHDTSPRLIVGDEPLLRVLGSALHAGLPSAAAASGQRTTLNVENICLGKLASQLPAEPLFTQSAAITPQTPFQIVFTSGTTSEPRGIVHTHRNILVSLAPIEREMLKYLRYERLVHPLRFLHMLPLSHVFGQFMGLWCPALLGAEVHFADEVEPSRIVSMIRRERISVLVAVPRMLALLRTHLLARFEELRSPLPFVRSPQARAVTHPTPNAQRTTQNAQPVPAGIRGVLVKWWRFRRVHRALGWKFWAVISGGATLPAELESFWNRPGFALIQGYGMTETAALVTLNHPFHIKHGSIGKPLPGREVQISEEGEVLVRGGMLAEATWQGGAMRKREGEWLATGDLAEKTASGELKFLGRKGDVIVTSAGLNIHPADLEAALTAQPGIRAAVVVACDLAAGPEPVAVVIPTFDRASPASRPVSSTCSAALPSTPSGALSSSPSGALSSSPSGALSSTPSAPLLSSRSGAEGSASRSDFDLQVAVDAANRTLAGYQQIRRVLRWPELDFPATSTGKLIRRQVAAWACAELRGNRAAAVPMQDSLLAVLAEVTAEPVPETPEPDALRLSEDLHLDSLGRVQLQSALEQRFAVEIGEDAIASARTVGELRALIAGNGEERSPLLERSPSSADPSGFHADDDGTADPTQGEPAFDHTQDSTVNGRRTTEKAPPGREASPHIYPRWPWSAPIRLLRTLWIECFMRPLVWLLAAPRVTVSSNLASRTSHPGPLLILCNHVTAYDGALVLYALPPHLRRRVAAAMSGEMLLDYRLGRNQGNALLNALAPAAYGLLTALFNVFPLPRARGFRRSFAHAGEAMDRVYSVLIFPEGTRSRTGRMNSFRPGIGLLAQQSQVPILPVALAGLYDLTASKTLDPGAPRSLSDRGNTAETSLAALLIARSPRSLRWFHSGSIEVRIGDIIPAPAEDADPAGVTAQLEAALRALLDSA